MNPFYDKKNIKKWSFSRWNWLWLWMFTTYVAFGTREDDTVLFYKVVGDKIYIVGEDHISGGDDGIALHE